jgi:hypothetical protein
MGHILVAHSWNRWLIIVVAVLAVIRLLMLLRREGNAQRLELVLVSGFANLLGLQMILGLVYLLWSGFAGAGFPAYRFLHAGIMVFAVITGEQSRRWKEAPVALYARNSLLCIGGALLLIFIGVASLPGGWTR